MGSYPRQFKNRAGSSQRKRKEYCERRKARCSRRCRKCTCKRGLVYYSKYDQCSYPPTTKQNTSTTSTTKVTSKPRRTLTLTISRFAKTEKSSTIRTLPSTGPRPSKPSFKTETQPVSFSSSKMISTSSTKYDSSPSYTEQNKPASATNSPTKSSVSRTNSPQTTKRITTTTASQGDKKMVAGGNDSHAGLIAGICVGFLVLIVCVVLILYFRKRKQKPKKVPEFVGSSDGFKFQDLKSRNEAERPVSPNGIYEYAYNKNVIGNPTYNAAIPMSEPFYSDLDGSGEQPVYREVFDEAGTGEQPIYREVCDDEQPVYKEIVANEVYMSPEAAGHQEQPLYREVEEGVPISPIYREIDADAPIYAMADKAVDAKAQQAAAGQDPSTYQQLNYAATANVYQGLSDDWKNQKYDR